MLQPLDDEGQQAIAARVGPGEPVDIVDGVDQFLGKGELVVVEQAFGAEGGRLGAHAVLRPEAGEKEALRKFLDRLEVRCQPVLLAGVVVEDAHPGPIWQPRAVDDKGHRQGVIFSPRITACSACHCASFIWPVSCQRVKPAADSRMRARSCAVAERGLFFSRR
jgi:hypothetical protein